MYLGLRYLDYFSFRKCTSVAVMFFTGVTANVQRTEAILVTFTNAESFGKCFCEHRCVAK